MKKVLFIVGSLRKGSFNHQTAKKAEELLKGKAEVKYLDYSKLPLMNQDLENPVQESVQAVRDEILAADAIWLFSPIYNWAIPGTVKNLLDWLSRSLDLTNPSGASALQDKVITVTVTAGSGHDKVFEAYNALLPFIRTKVVGDFTAVTINPEAWGSGELSIASDVVESIEKQAEELLKA